MENMVKIPSDFLIKIVNRFSFLWQKHGVLYRKIALLAFYDFMVVLREQSFLTENSMLKSYKYYK